MWLGWGQLIKMLSGQECKNLDKLWRSHLNPLQPPAHLPNNKSLDFSSQVLDLRNMHCIYILYTYQLKTLHFIWSKVMKKGLSLQAERQLNRQKDGETQNSMPRIIWFFDPEKRNSDIVYQQYHIRCTGKLQYNTTDYLVMWQKVLRKIISSNTVVDFLNLR